MNTLSEKIITPEQAITLLKKENNSVSLEKAIAIIKFMSLLAEG